MFKKILALGIMIGSVYAGDQTYLEGLPGIYGQWPVSIENKVITWFAMKTAIIMTGSEFSRTFYNLDSEKIKGFFENNDIRGLADYIKNSQSETSTEIEADS